MSYTQSEFRISVYDTTGAGRGRGKLKATIRDAKYIGVSSYLNEGGEVFFTLPYNHPQVNECDPLSSHYSIERFDEDSGLYTTIGNGIINDYVATDDEVVFYGVDYLTVLNQTLTEVTAAVLAGATVTYNDNTLSQIFQAEMSAAKNQTDSRLGFINIEATINASADTYDLFTAGENRTDFLRNACSIAQAGNTQKIVFGNRIETDSQSYNSFFLDLNYKPTVNNKLTLSYGANVKRFSYTPNYKNLRTRAILVATNISGAAASKIWSSVATSGTIYPSLGTTLISAYGAIERVDIRQDILSSASAEVDKLAKQNLYESSPDKIKEVSVSIVDGSVIPFKDYVLGDDIRVIINRGPANLNTNLTLRGQQWIGREDGSESLTFDFYNRNQAETEVTPYKPGGALSASGNQGHIKPNHVSGANHLSGKPKKR